MLIFNFNSGLIIIKYPSCMIEKLASTPFQPILISLNCGLRGNMDKNFKKSMRKIVNMAKNQTDRQFVFAQRHYVEV